MANLKISELTETTTPDAASEIPFALAGANGKVKVSNLGHFKLLTADPVTPANDTWWVVREGTSPTQTVSLKARIGGATYTVASITR